MVAFSFFFFGLIVYLVGHSVFFIDLIMFSQPVVERQLECIWWLLFYTFMGYYAALNFQFAVNDFFFFPFSSLTNDGH